MKKKIIFNINIKCKICGKVGKNIFSERFLSKSNINFLNNYYNRKFFTYINKLSFVNYNFELRKCSECSFMWQTNSLKKNFSNILYEKIIDRIESIRKNTLKYEDNQFNLEKQFIYKKLDKSSKILDFGAGWGGWLSNFRYNFDTYAVELSISRIKNLIKKNIKIVKLREKKYLNFFNCIKADQVFEHIDNLDHLMKDIKKISHKQKCFLLITVPNGIKVLKNHNNYLYKKGPIQPLEHLNCFTNKSLTLLMQKYNFYRIGFYEFFSFLLFFLIKNPKKFLTVGKKIYDQYYGTSVIFK